MKKLFLPLAALIVLSAQANSGFDIQPPKLNISCSMSDASFTLYKGTRCTGGGTDILRPRCIEYNIKKALELDVSEAKYFNHEEALTYLKEQLKK